MECRSAKELLHVKSWLDRVDEIIDRGKDAYLADDLLQEAGDWLMMKLGEAANRLSRLDVLAPDGVDWALAVANRNFLIHQYDEINRMLTWLTLSRDLPAWNRSLQPLFDAADAAIGEGPGRVDERPVLVARPVGPGSGGSLRATRGFAQRCARRRQATVRRNSSTR
jgi:uncharacterized protein with HEPN domain